MQGSYDEDQRSMNNIEFSFLTSLIIFVCSLMASTGTIVAPICCVIPPASPSCTWVWRIYKHKILIQLTLYQDSRPQLCFLRISWRPSLSLLFNEVVSFAVHIKLIALQFKIFLYLKAFSISTSLWNIARKCKLCILNLSDNQKKSNNLRFRS